MLFINIFYISKIANSLMLQGPNKKYFKRSELAAKEAEEYRQKYGQLKQEEAENTHTASAGMVWFINIKLT